MQARSPKSRPPERGPAGRRLPSWENVQAFLHVVEHGSFRAAALKLGMSINRLRHRVAKLERQLGATLLTRHVDGVRATAEGEQVLAAARNMQQAYFELMRASEIAHPSVVREVKLAAAEGLGTVARAAACGLPSRESRAAGRPALRDAARRRPALGG